MTKPSLSHWQLQLIAKKSHSVRQCFNPFAQRKHGRVTAKLAVVEENRMFGNICRLQPGRHLTGVKGIAVSVSVTRNDHRGGVRHSLSHFMIRRVLCEGGEIVRIVHGTEFVFPNVRIVEEVVTKHIQHRNHADHSAEQVWSLCQSCSYDQTCSALWSAWFRCWICFVTTSSTMRT